MNLAAINMNISRVGIEVLIVSVLIIGISLFRTPRGARAGNMAAALALLCSVAAVWIAAPVLDVPLVLGALLIGSAAGTFVAARATMIKIPAMVAFQHGAGGIAAFLISFTELTRPGQDGVTIGLISGIMGMVIGAATSSASLLASAKLANRIRQTPTVLKGHNFILLALVACVIVAAVFICHTLPALRAPWLAAVIVMSMVTGIVFAVRIGGADMPVLISFLNAAAGLAAAFCGIIIQNRLLIVSGATVAASGSILTHVMCRAMNRSLIRIFLGSKNPRPGAGATDTETDDGKAASLPCDKFMAANAKPADERAADCLAQAKRVIIIPGYGMALAQAQFAVVELSLLLESMGKEVSFAIHPVAGRMPGHMNVLLAEAEVSYDKLVEMDDINPRFREADVALVVGACDVVNPAAIKTEGTPISGMPILTAQESRNVIICNLDEKPGYSGVPNPLYNDPRTIMLTGDATATVTGLVAALKKRN